MHVQCTMDVRIKRVQTVLQSGNLRELFHLAYRMLSADVGMDVRARVISAQGWWHAN